MGSPAGMAKDTKVDQQPQQIDGALGPEAIRIRRPLVQSRKVSERARERLRARGSDAVVLRADRA